MLLKAAETLSAERYEQIFHQTFFTASTIILYNANPPSWQPGIFDAMFSNSTWYKENFMRFALKLKTKVEIHEWSIVSQKARHCYSCQLVLLLMRKISVSSQSPHKFASLFNHVSISITIARKQHYRTITSCHSTITDRELNINKYVNERVPMQTIV